MAKLAVVAVRDSAVDAFMRPLFVPTLGLGTRVFSDEVNRPDSEMHRHPDDYDLYHLGEWDEATGRFFSLEQPSLIVRGKDVQK